ncbi:hypothetical protein VPNG_07770 [Cytospora leucostoma]|uniref:Uncharacterized protein n=1 Tax=Cytospora leucostoma TaxID=1230097 RepID=A0A423WEI3_9PEZI|nr:hypothetical protein VPNG_07770 [Cytospora leucostoma]
MADSSSALNISGALAVVEWVDDDGQKQFLPASRTGISATPQVRGELTCDLTFNPSSNSAFCKLNFPFVSTLRPKEVLPLSLLIPPERVTTLDMERPGDALPEDVSMQLGKEVVRLQFNMASPADLVVPQDSLASGQAGSRGKRPQGSTSGPSRDFLPSYDALQPSVPGSQYDSPKKRRRPSSATDVEEDHIRVLRKLVVEMYGGLGQEVESVKEELRATKQELRATKQELQETKQELHEAKEKMHETQQEIHEAKEELLTIKQEVREAKQQLGEIKQEVDETKEKLHEVKQEMHESQRITTQAIHLTTEQNSSRVEAIHQRQDGVVGTLRAIVDTLTNIAKEEASLLDRVRTEVTKDVVEYIDESHAFDLTDDTVDWLIDSAMHRLDVYTRDEVDERLNEVQEHCEGLNDLETDVYTKDEVDERLNMVQEHCEGLNNLETEDMVLGAKSELEEDVRNEIKDAKLDLGKWVQDRVSRKMRRMAEAVEDKLQAAKDQVMEVLKTALVRVQDLQAPPRLQSDTFSTASTASA